MIGAQLASCELVDYGWTEFSSSCGRLYLRAHFSDHCTGYFMRHIEVCDFVNAA